MVPAWELAAGNGLVLYRLTSQFVPDGTNTFDDLIYDYTLQPSLHHDLSAVTVAVQLPGVVSAPRPAVDTNTTDAEGYTGDVPSHLYPMLRCRTASGFSRHTIHLPCRRSEWRVCPDLHAVTADSYGLIVVFPDAIQLWNYVVYLYNLQLSCLGDSFCSHLLQLSVPSRGGLYTSIRWGPLQP